MPGWQGEYHSLSTESLSNQPAIALTSCMFLIIYFLTYNMPTTLNVPLVQQRAESFPAAGWQTIGTQIFVADRRGRIFSDWSPTPEIKELEGVGGVYAILLPCAWFLPARTVPLHGPHLHDGPILFEFSVPAITNDGYGVVYAGRTTNLRQRWRGHLSRGSRKDGGQVKFGLLDCGIEATPDAALQRLREHARITFTVLNGPDECANRDLLELSLCARFAPPFNIKSER